MELFVKPMTYKEYIRYLIPSVMTMIFLSFYTTIDGYFVSRYAGSDALAGINIVIPVTCIIFGVSVMLATGGGAIIGEHMGRGEKQRADEIFSSISLALLVFSIIFTIVGIVCLRPAAILLGSSERLLEHVLPYLFVVFAGTIPMSFKLFFEYLVRTDGKPKVGLAMSFVGLLLNVILDYIFVAHFHFGTFGAALGTVIAISASTLIGLIYFLWFSNIHFRRPKLQMLTLLKACINGSSEMLTELSTGITTFLFNIIIMNAYGEDGVAAVTIIMYIYYFFISFYMGIAVATAPVVSFCLGADNKRKIKETLKYSFTTIGATALVILSILYLFGDHIIAIFVAGGPVFALTSKALLYFSPVFLFIGVNVFLSGYFTALGDGLTSAVISSLRSLVFVVIFLLILPKVLGVTGIWIAMPFAEVTTILISLWLFAKRGIVFLR